MISKTKQKKKEKKKIVRVDSYTRIKKALEDDKYTFRTIGGVAKAANVSEAEVKKALQEHKEEVVELYRKGVNGEKLVSTRKHYKKKATWKEKMMGAVLNRVY
ncbi:hypothetical protein [Vibrio kanaloae]|uniref:hypothetical protein n=1 Tax=Vibrio kanaloae TaxID=170673 RepID=UPI0010BD9C9E|nr:hypothetical protein [Vibrio kanaloae]TKF06584.1 hypothetical protein FCV46_03900 [Vibrio kanaloae]TKF65038.1 hypothetical protein FCV51_02910 [Vibrio kanaloae]